MSITAITALVHCDGCNEPFKVDIDPAGNVENWSAYDFAEDAVRGGNAGAGLTSVQHDKHLCSVCTNKVDRMVPEEEDRSATFAELTKALEL